MLKHWAERQATNKVPLRFIKAAEPVQQKKHTSGGNGSDADVEPSKEEVDPQGVNGNQVQGVRQPQWGGRSNGSEQTPGQSLGNSADGLQQQTDGDTAPNLPPTRPLHRCSSPRDDLSPHNDSPPRGGSPPWDESPSSDESPSCGDSPPPDNSPSPDDSPPRDDSPPCDDSLPHALSSCCALPVTHPLNHPPSDGPRPCQTNGVCNDDKENGSGSAAEPSPTDKVSNLYSLMEP